MVTNFNEANLAPGAEIYIQLQPSTLGLHLHIIPINLGANPAYNQVQYEITKEKQDFVSPVEGTFYYNASSVLNQSSIEYQYFNACNKEQAWIHIKNSASSNSSIQYQLTQTDGYVFTSVVYDDIP